MSLRLQVFQAALFARRSVIGVLFCLSLGACAVDAKVYDERSMRRDAGGAGGAGGAGNAGAPSIAVYGCAAGAQTGMAILEEILMRLGDDLFTPGMACSSDADCGRTLIRPRCEPQMQTCVPCADPAQQALFGTNLGFCLAAAGQTCCHDPKAAPDCIVRQCQLGCGAP